MADQEMRIDMENYVDQMAQVLGLPLDAEFRPGVIDNVVRTMAIAQLVLEFPLPEDIEAAPTFQP
jgi:hypothetical protein